MNYTKTYNMLMEMTDEQDKKIIRELFPLIKTVSTKEELFRIAELFKELKSEFLKNFNNGQCSALAIGSAKDMYNRSIGWGLPDKAACDVMFEEWKRHQQKYPKTRVWDIGTSSGVFAYIFEQMGIDIVAYDLPKPTHISSRRFYNKITTELFMTADDILFISWGISGQNGVKKIVNEYIKIGGKSIIILGTYILDKTTFPVDFFYNSKHWKITRDEKIATTLWDSSEYITVNRLLTDI